MREGIGLYAIQLPCRGRRFSERAIDRVDTIVKEVTDSLAGLLDLPFALFGHSMGALLAFEVARMIPSRYGLTAQVLFVSAHSAPRILRAEPKISELPEDEFIARILALDGTPHEVFHDPQLRSITLPALRADFRAIEAYEYRAGEPLSCDITAFAGIDDRHFTLDTMIAWESETTASFKFHSIPGGHFFINESQSELLALIIRELSTALLKIV